MDIGINKVITKLDADVELVSLEEIQESATEVMELLLDIDRKDEAVATVESLIACVKSNGYEDTLKTLHGTELQAAGIDTDVTAEELIVSLETLIAVEPIDGFDLPVAVDGVEPSEEVLMAVAIVAVAIAYWVAVFAIVTIWVNHVRKLNASYNKPWSGLPAGEFDKALADKAIKSIGAKECEAKLITASKVLKDMGDNGTKITDMATLEKMAKALNGDLDDSGKLTVATVNKTKTTIGEAGWTNATVESMRKAVVATSGKFINYDKVLSANIKTLKKAKGIEFKGNPADAKKAITATKAITKEAMKQYTSAAKEYTSVVMKSNVVRDQAKKGIV